MAKYLYVARCEELNKTKIGITDDIKRRMAHLSYEQGCDVTLEFNSHGVENPEECEEQALSCCVNNIKGEWFGCTREHAIRCVVEAVKLKGIAGNVVNKSSFMVAPGCVSKEQKEWMQSEAKRTGNSQASIMRKLIQKEIDDE